MALSLDIWYVASLSGSQPSLFKLCPNGQKWPHPGGHMFYIGIFRENHEKIFLFENTMPRALSFGMLHHLVNFYQVCSNYSPWAKSGPALGSHVLHRLI